MISSSLLSQIQSVKNLRTVEVVIHKDSISYKIDSLTILPSSFRLYSDVEINRSDYKLVNNGIEIPNKLVRENLHDATLKFEYRILPIDIEKSYSHLNSNLLQSKDQAIYIGYDYRPEKPKNPLIQEQGIDYDGSFARGFSLGNNQSLLLNSNFNMQMAGDLGDGLRIKAAISDENIPIQPEGNTQLLQEFDKVYIQVDKNKSSIIAGDYELNRPNSYFINYFKQVQGLSVRNIYDIDENQQVQSMGSFAISRAKFNRFTLNVQEGNQGPYKVPGANGERFIIVESGSERVYEDGKLLKRGKDHDYTISYDRAEISFTEKKLITTTSRIIVEYEYVDRNYLRTMYAGSTQYQSKNWEVNFNFYSQQDSKSVTGENELDSVELSILTEIGDAEAFRSGISLFQGEERDNSIRYKIEDDVLIYSTNPDSALYVAAFSEVPFGEGDYIIDTNVSANGRVYVYAGPGQGNYIPEIQLIAPQKTQIMSVGAKYAPSQNTNITSEFSLSNQDLNRFSTINNEDNQGLAGYLKADHKFVIDSAIVLVPFAAIELTQDHFKSLNPYRATEFIRDWNLQSLLPSDERIIRSGFNVSNGGQQNLEYVFSNFNRTLDYDGTKHNLNYNLSLLGFKFTSKSSFLSSQDNLERTSFLRPNFGLSKKLGTNSSWEIGYLFDGEKNERRVLATDDLNLLSRSYDINRVYLTRTNNKSFTTSLSLEKRNDRSVLGSDLVPLTTANAASVSAKWVPSKNSNLNIDFTFRDLKIENNVLADELSINAKKSYLGQIDYNLKALNGFLKTTTSYNIGSGQQAKIEFDYQEVLPGEGNYDWIDTNMDNIQQTGEFIISEFQDTSRWIQVPLYNNEFVQTNNSGINQSLRLDPKLLYINANKKRKERILAINKERSLRKKQMTLIDSNSVEFSLLTQEEIKSKIEEATLSKPQKPNKFQNVISRFSSVSTFRINKKVETDDTDYNPLNLSSQDTSIINYTSFINNTLFFNRGNSSFDFQIGNRKNEARLLQIAGLDIRSLSEYFSRIRVGLNKKIDLILNVKKGNRIGESPFQSRTDFKINYQAYNPEINYRPLSNLRFIAKYEFEKKNEIFADLTAISQDFTFENSFRKSSSYSWDTGISFVKVSYDGDENSILGFEILEGLKKGNNYLWNTSFTKRLQNNVDFIINYEGRKTGSSRVIHTARAQVKATF